MSLSKVFEDNIKDLYHAEKQLIKALPKLIKKSTDSNLRSSLEMHLGETEEHVRRLEQVAEMLGIKPTGKVCHGMMGLVEEANEHVGELEPGATMDAVIIECAQKAEHYEICAYGTLCTWGAILGQDEIVSLLEQNMADEENADTKLTEIAEAVVNEKALREEIGQFTNNKGGTSNTTGAKKLANKAVVNSKSNGTAQKKEKAGATRR